MEDIRANLSKIRGQIREAAEGCGRTADDVLLVAVSKTRTPEEINIAIDAGVTDIGENKVQEIMDKYDAVKPVKWHMIGHLQTNKVKYIIDKVSMIHSVDSYKLAAEINKRSASHGITMDILIQVNSAQEESKFGITTEETETLIKEILDTCENVRIRGLMTIPPVNCDEKYFASMQELFENSKQKYSFLSGMDTLSMGMSGDYATAVKYGSTLVRIGSGLFGYRNYSKI